MLKKLLLQRPQISVLLELGKRINSFQIFRSYQFNILRVNLFGKEPYDGKLSRTVRENKVLSKGQGLSFIELIHVLVSYMY